MFSVDVKVESVLCIDFVSEICCLSVLDCRVRCLLCLVNCVMVSCLVRLVMFMLLLIFREDVIEEVEIFIVMIMVFGVVD